MVSLFIDQVQNDLTQLRKRLGRIDQDGTLDVQALEAVIRRTEDSIKVTDTLLRPCVKFTVHQYHTDFMSSILISLISYFK